MSTALDIMST